MKSLKDVKKIKEREISKKEIEENEHKLVDLNAKDLTDNEKKLYDLVLTIIENEELSDEDKSLLLDYLEIDRAHMNKDEELKARADKVFNEME